ncbi:DUF1549 domain-containing protein [uncultured Paludibaculum sp.]|uniref:DUF1549 domain-containing protein n=1 Tax=uncultured Paludibaculum sp. TaxID=1765020 RepID=UPI002AABFA5F|nr:DUF1549 domain-containing protein [uncultured Paludibaculum sp.]
MQFGWAYLGLGLCYALSAQTVDFARQVHPVLVEKCLPCHNGAGGQGGLSLAARAEILRGGAGGPAIAPGESGKSLLVRRIDGSQPPRMPMGGEPLSEREIATIRRWIDEGARGEVNAAPTARFSLSLKPPKASGIDALMASYYQNRKVAPPPQAEDAVFARRVYLDLWGLLPPAEDLRRFLADTRPDKRTRLVDELLANQKNYAEHWISFWNDLLHNDEGVVYHGDRASISPWLLKALEENKRYDEFVRTLLAPAEKDGPAGFVRGVTWRGTVNASQTPAMQAAQNSAQVFLGINLKCNSCHDSFISHWKLREAYALASFFTNEPLEIVKCDKGTGKMADTMFLFPELGGIDAKAAVEEKRAAAARMFTTKENGLFARTIVNRTWRLLLGRGLVEPLDEMEGPSWYPELLEWLAADFVEHGYDMKYLLRTIVTSKAYQSASVPAGNAHDQTYVFHGPWPRRITAEEFADGVASLTGEWRIRVDNRPVPGMYAREWRFKASSMTRALGRPTRDGAVTERQEDSTTLQALELTNGLMLNDWLSEGARRLTGHPDTAAVSLFDSGTLRGTGKAKVDVDVTGRKELRLLVTDVDSYDPSRVKVGWRDARLMGPSGEEPVAGEVALGKEIVINLEGKGYTRFQALLAVDPSSNQSDISPAVRGFLFDRAPNMQKLVAAAGDPPLPRPKPSDSPASLIDQVYRHAYGRPPAPTEKQIAMGLVAKGSKVDREGLQDLLWTVVMSPEFQFIR